MIRLRRVALTLVVFSAATTLGACAREPEFALVIPGRARQLDGAGGEAQPADVGIKGDRIAAIGNLSGRSAAAAIDATGKIVAPGLHRCEEPTHAGECTCRFAMPSAARHHD